ncbi:conserved hypothetical protein [Chloroherpeton thalassium ATCC 35110]|uniref:DUF2214 family protein n=1 Tax=Chloroherpeton thalassium (strain ATCC 35110 / GB-78) TaxID=517418 RepID=B3QVU4_CHLT3|nr:DUF2214 family protein [Chloroherpeton thalassium]ACF13151.1 conserved hypothetical protein [Chloroherpeton thalassium ATCC 35110]
MLLSSLIAAMHHLAAFAIAAALAVEFATFSRAITAERAKAIQLADMTYGIASIFIIVVGILRVVSFTKGVDFYIGNVFFWVKMLAFSAMGGLSIYPTIQFFSWSKRLKEGQLPEITVTQEKLIKRLILFELACLSIVVVAAPLMATGFALCP